MSGTQENKLTIHNEPYVSDRIPSASACLSKGVWAEQEKLVIITESKLWALDFIIAGFKILHKSLTHRKHFPHKLLDPIFPDIHSQKKDQDPALYATGPIFHDAN